MQLFFVPTSEAPFLLLQTQLLVKAKWGEPPEVKECILIIEDRDACGILCEAQKVASKAETLR